MALRLRHWLGLVGLGFVLAAIWALPPRVLQLAGPPIYTHETQRYHALRRDLNDSYETLQRLRWVDSLSAMVVRSARDERVVLAPPSADPGQVAHLQRRWADAERGSADADVALAYVFQPRDHGVDLPVWSDRRPTVETYLGRRDGVDYCMRIRVARNPALVIANAIELPHHPGSSPSLGACRLVARYGMPGAGVRRWLENGGSSWALADAVQAATEQAAPSYGRRSAFGRYRLGSVESLGVDRCLAGSADACAAVFLDPALARRSIELERRAARRASALSVRDVGEIFLGEGAFLMADLERAFGTDAFARFWRAEADVETAFRDAFGVEVGPWVLAWADTTIGVDPPGPRLAGSGSTLPVGLTLALFAMIAVAQVRRHRVS